MNLILIYIPFSTQNVWVFAEYTKGLNSNTLIIWKLPSLKYWLSYIVAFDSINVLLKNICFLLVQFLKLKSDCI